MLHNITEAPYGLQAEINIRSRKRKTHVMLDYDDLDKGRRTFPCGNGDDYDLNEEDLSRITRHRNRKRPRI